MQERGIRMMMMMMMMKMTTMTSMIKKAEQVIVSTKSWYKKYSY
jgi:hypothetical protein